MTTIIMISNDSSVIINPSNEDDASRGRSGAAAEAAASDPDSSSTLSSNSSSSSGTGMSSSCDQTLMRSSTSVSSSAPSSPLSSQCSNASTENSSMATPDSSFITPRPSKGKTGSSKKPATAASLAGNGSNKNHQHSISNWRRYKNSVSSTLESDSEELNNSSSSAASTLSSRNSLGLISEAIPSIYASFDEDQEDEEESKTMTSELASSSASPTTSASSSSSSTAETASLSRRKARNDASEKQQQQQQQQQKSRGGRKFSRPGSSLPRTQSFSFINSNNNGSEDRSSRHSAVQINSSTPKEGKSQTSSSSNSSGFNVWKKSSPVNGPHGLKFYVNPESGKIDLKTNKSQRRNYVGLSEGPKSLVDYDTRSLGRRLNSNNSNYNVINNYGAASLKVGIGQSSSALDNAINIVGLPNVLPNYCTLARKKTSNKNNNTGSKPSALVSTSSSSSIVTTTTSSAKASVRLCFDSVSSTGRREEDSGSSGDKQSVARSQSEVESNNQRNIEPPSFSIYSDINDFQELFKKDRIDGPGNSAAQEPSAPTALKSLKESFWQDLDTEDDFVEDIASVVSTSDDDDVLDSGDDFYKSKAVKKSGPPASSTPMLPTGCHRHPQHLSMPTAAKSHLEVRKSSPVESDDEYLTSLLRDDWNSYSSLQRFQNERQLEAEQNVFSLSLNRRHHQRSKNQQRSQQSSSNSWFSSPEVTRRRQRPHGAGGGIRQRFRLGSKSSDALTAASSEADYSHSRSSSKNDSTTPSERRRQRSSSSRKSSVSGTNNSSNSNSSGGGKLAGVKLDKIRSVSSALSGLNLANTRILRRHTTYVKATSSSGNGSTSSVTSKADDGYENPAPSSPVHVHSWHKKGSGKVRKYARSFVYVVPGQKRQSRNDSQIHLEKFLSVLLSERRLFGKKKKLLKKEISLQR